MYSQTRSFSLTVRDTNGESTYRTVNAATPSVNIAAECRGVIFLTGA